MFHRRELIGLCNITGGTVILSRSFQDDWSYSKTAIRAAGFYTRGQKSGEKKAVILKKGSSSYRLAGSMTFAMKKDTIRVPLKGPGRKSARNGGETGMRRLT